MATEQEIEDAEKRVDDKALLEEALTDLNTIANGSGAFTLLIERDGVQFNLNTLLANLSSGNAAEDTMVSNIESFLGDLIGEDEITANTIRKALRDLVTSHEADIAAT